MNIWLVSCRFSLFANDQSFNIVSTERSITATYWILNGLRYLDQDIRS